MHTVKKKEQYDCETIISTYSTLYNHPSILGANTNVDKATGHIILKAPKGPKGAPFSVHSTVIGRGPTVIGARGGGDDDAELGSGDEDEESIADYEFVQLSERPRDESKEEKSMRRQLVKQVQRERRAEKKNTKAAYKQAHILAGERGPQNKQQKAQMSLSVVRAK
jgi:protein LTV1